jgi:hypothetical protein
MRPNPARVVAARCAQTFGYPKQLMDRPFGADMALDERFAELIEIGRNEIPERRSFWHDNGDGRFGREAKLLAVPELHPQWDCRVSSDAIDQFFKAILEKHVVTSALGSNENRLLHTICRRYLDYFYIPHARTQIAVGKCANEHRN